MEEYERNMRLADQFTTASMDAMRKRNLQDAEINALCAQAHATMALAASNMEKK